MHGEWDTKAWGKERGSKEEHGSDVDERPGSRFRRVDGSGRGEGGTQVHVEIGEGV